ncbi:metallophosphoesterase [Chloropicon primus]|uniref:Metallophosphoesterase n=1 Tax=Chloropicon primus TaxID=1764295 RepID=A0A5B8MCN7_9CHLO|nr:metallophosphoesterase [Chloropicon primus]UPQ97040.1 metallophosphoesterase [Chloropicon primus]|eukprot:QDZ17824.1 metallophosphoesterase [Chloropicon primus]
MVLGGVAASRFLRSWSPGEARALGCRGLGSPRPWSWAKGRGGGTRGDEGVCHAGGSGDFDSMLKIACVGDVHGLWNEESEEALSWLQPDLSLFVGDFGEEDVDLVSQISRLSARKAVILGNHDGWYSTKGGGSMEGVEEQLDLLGDDHVGLSAKCLPDLGLSVVGCRPFSAGGGDWSRFSNFYRDLYGLRGFDDSTTQIVGACLAEPEHHPLLLLSHNGPSGLGSTADSPCGKDWRPEEGDYGDKDMEDAIAAVLERGRRIPLAVFGHMHHKLHRCALPKTERKMFHKDDTTGVAYVNCAVVPRIRRGPEGGLQHNYVLITLSTTALEVEKVESVWLQKRNDSFHTVERTDWYTTS